MFSVHARPVQFSRPWLKVVLSIKYPRIPSLIDSAPSISVDRLGLNDGIGRFSVIIQSRRSTTDSATEITDLPLNC